MAPFMVLLLLATASAIRNGAVQGDAGQMNNTGEEQAFANDASNQGVSMFSEGPTKSSKRCQTCFQKGWMDKFVCCHVAKPLVRPAQPSMQEERTLASQKEHKLACGKKRKGGRCRCWSWSSGYGDSCTLCVQVGFTTRLTAVGCACTLIFSALGCWNSFWCKLFARFRQIALTAELKFRC